MTNLLSRGLVLAALALTASPAAAQGRAWCLYENNSRGAVRCSFYTFEQCQETRSGLGGSCAANPYPSHGAPYSGDRPTEGRKRRR
jgi:Protein of unknown function (DUF3551)